MLCVLAFHSKDKHLASKLARWIEELGGVSQYRLILVTARDTDSVGVIEPLQRAFSEVIEIHPVEEVKGWPQGPNSMWDAAVRYIDQWIRPAEPWMWIETDSVPLVPTWMDDISVEYAKGGKAFMGDRVEVGGVDSHMSGCAVYPHNVMSFTNRLWELGPVAWDVFLASDFMPHAHFTPIIQHLFWESRTPDVEPSFKDQASLSILRPGAVLFHRDKTSNGLIDRLREARGKSPKELPASPFVAAVVKSASSTMHTYYQAVPEIDSTEAQRLLSAWRAAWRAQGWDVRILSESDAKAHPLYVEFSTAIDRLPTINPPAYERACYMRHLAMAAVGGGFLCDYDVFPLSFQPQKAEDRFTLWQDNNPCPSMTSGTADEYERVCRLFMEYRPSVKDATEDGRIHCSDQNILSKLGRDAFDAKDVVKHWSAKGWEKAPAAVHFPSAVMVPAGKTPRSEHIPLLIGAGRPVKAEKPSPNGNSTSIAGRMREHCTQLAAIVDGNNARKAVLRTELRKAGLIGEGKRRK